jgi:hypothetical protein
LAQQIPAPTDLPGDPFFVKKTWQAGGSGDSLNSVVLDPAQSHLFLAYRQAILVDDLESGAVVGRVSGTFGSYGIALDDTGEFGYVSDGRYNQVDVFDRRSFQLAGVIPTAPDPTGVVFEPASALIFAICSKPLVEQPSNIPALRTNARNRSGLIPGDPHAVPKPPYAKPTAGRPVKNPETTWFITVIDANTWKALADIQLSGKVAFAQTAGNGHVYLSIQNRNDSPGKYEVARIETDALGEMLRNKDAEIHATVGRTPKQEQLRSGPPPPPGPGWQRYPVQDLDWSGAHNSGDNDERLIRYFTVARECGEPRALAADERHVRLFVACSNMTLAVLNADNGDQVASVPTGPSTNAVAYDFDHNLIYAANGGGNGSLTVIRQSVTDSYAVVQNLPTYQKARALAVNPATGLGYLATDYSDLDPTQHRLSPTDGSFYVQVIGH